MNNECSEYSEYSLFIVIICIYKKKSCTTFKIRNIWINCQLKSTKDRNKTICRHRLSKVKHTRKGKLSKRHIRKGKCVLSSLSHNTPGLGVGPRSATERWPQKVRFCKKNTFGPGGFALQCVQLAIVITNFRSSFLLSLPSPLHILLLNHLGETPKAEHLFAPIFWHKLSIFYSEFILCTLEQSFYSTTLLLTGTD